MFGHRLFDMWLIVRQGLRYALARHSLDVLIPLLGALLVFDALVHRDQPLVSQVAGTRQVGSGSTGYSSL